MSGQCHRLLGPCRLRLATAPARPAALADRLPLLADLAARGPLEQILTVLRERERVRQGRDPTPSAGIIDSQSVRITDRGLARLRRRQEGERAQGPPAGRHPRPPTPRTSDRRQCRRPRRRRHAPVRRSRQLPRLRHGWVDAGYRGPLLDWAREVAGVTLQVVQRRDGGIRRRWLPAGTEPPVMPLLRRLTSS